VSLEKGIEDGTISPQVDFPRDYNMKGSRLITFQLYGLAALVTACQQVQNQVRTDTLNSCKNQPKLESRNLKGMDFSDQETKNKGVLDPKTSLGYEFSAQAGQMLKFSTEPAICVRIFNAGNQALSEPVFPSTGKYIMQISTLDGVNHSTDFNMTATLTGGKASKSAKASPKPSATSSVSPEKPPSQESSHPSAVEFVKTHYQLLNNRDYKATWNRLSTRFQRKSKDYLEWWDKVNSIQVGTIKSISQNNEAAIVDAEISYEMKDGRTKQDENRRIHLLWNQSRNAWEIDNKTAPKAQP
jgi:hypothetical protein